MLLTILNFKASKWIRYILHTRKDTTMEKEIKSFVEAIEAKAPDQKAEIFETWKKIFPRDNYFI